ncbi:CoA-binding protein [Neptunicoccus cionae]|uniref:CoA-binding protein n=1 Tax=Neptunicoccus cionae TaxID=2035344 RepID=UPI000C7642C0|nr:CoA-binding protein [Amylibacter cionae]PLS20965.1 CoA-binding protein [Amylibacter cionae]
MSETYSDELLRSVLKRTKTIACIGVSTNPVRPSHYVARYMGLRGYRVIPVNPVYAGQELFGETVRGDLSELKDDSVDMVDIFRRSEAVPPIVEESLSLLSGLQTIWMQIGVRHADAASRAEAAGVTVIQNRCPKIEYQRLFGELRKGGFNTGIISSRL